MTAAARPEPGAGCDEASVIDSVLLIAFGGPTRPEEIRPFIENVTRGRRIPRARIEEVVRHYERMPGGRSPLGELTERQAAALRGALARAGRPLPVHTGMRNWHPYLAESLAAMAAAGARRALGIILSPFRTEASWDRYQQDVARAQAGVSGAPEVVFAPGWSAHPLFIEAVADRAAAVLNGVPADRRAWTPLIFTAHSVPVSMADASPYVAEFSLAAERVADRLRHKRWSIAFQSRSGGPQEPWLEPDIGDVVRSVANDGEGDLVIVPIGFVCDHVEVLYDLDVEVRTLAEERGIRLHRAPALNDHPRFIELLAELVGQA
jgi:protoporphyrin/coproporphyrin ferrochelatase